MKRHYRLSYDDHVTVFRENGKIVITSAPASDEDYENFVYIAVDEIPDLIRAINAARKDRQ